MVLLGGAAPSELHGTGTGSCWGCQCHCIHSCSWKTEACYPGLVMMLCESSEQGSLFLWQRLWCIFRLFVGGTGRWGIVWVFHSWASGCLLLPARSVQKLS